MNNNLFYNKISLRFLKVSIRICLIILLETAKIVEYDRKRGIIFLLNKDKASQSLNLYTIKLKYADHDDSDSDDGGSKINSKYAGGSSLGADRSVGGFKFGFIKELRLNINYSII